MSDPDLNDIERRVRDLEYGERTAAASRLDAEASVREAFGDQEGAERLREITGDIRAKADRIRDGQV